ncbi:unnamed protein product [Mytilus edulis]|uniref:DDE-1 domain-containing protein n=1 Tax=Mytilus edulis TaxID=6550 RepID=A0A8S3QIF4_MYTED|nr:unnamed protein product [Mytilus edulis]
MSHLGYGYTRVEVTALASDYAVSIKLKDKTDKQLSLQWFRSFMDRWPDLKLQKPRALSISRAKGASKEVIDSYFDELENILNKYDLKNKPHCIYNIDEKGITPEHTPPKVVADVEINASAVTSERDKTTTIIAAGNAIGTQIPPFLVFAGQRMRQELIQGCTPGTTGDVSPTGWSNTDIFQSYLQTHFINYVQGLSDKQPILVIYDGHLSHVSLSVIDWAKTNNIILLVLPAHTSHLLQPLDVGCFGPLSKIYNHSCHKFMRENHCKISRYNVGELCTNAYVKGLSPDNLKSSFKRSGIYPLDKSPYPPQMYLPATVYTQTETDGQNQETDDIIDHLNDINVPLTSDQTDSIDNSPPMDLSPGVNQVLVGSPTKTLSPEIMTQVPVNSPPMDLSPDIFRFFDDPDFMDIDIADKTDTLHDNEETQDIHMTLTDIPRDRTLTESPTLSTFFHSREKGMSNKNIKKNNRKCLSKIVSGKSITEENVIECIKEHCQSKKSVTKSSKINSSKTKSSSKKKSSTKKNERKGVQSKGNSSPTPGTSGLQVIYLSDSQESLYEHESQMSESDLCCVCHKFYPQKLKECGDLTIAKWGQCMFDGCSHWVHLRFCCNVRAVRTHSIFNCPCHGLPCLQEE